MAQQTMTQLKKVLYTAIAHTTSGRDGASHSDEAAWTYCYQLPATRAPAPTPKETIHLRTRSFFLEGE